MFLKVQVVLCRNAEFCHFFFFFLYKKLLILCSDFLEIVPFFHFSSRILGCSIFKLKPSTFNLNFKKLATASKTFFFLFYCFLSHFYSLYHSIIWNAYVMSNILNNIHIRIIAWFHCLSLFSTLNNSERQQSTTYQYCT